jgi:hypothetical protein
MLNLPFVVSVNRPERICNGMFTNRHSSRSAIVAGRSEVNAGENPGLGDFIQRRRKARK